MVALSDLNRQNQTIWMRHFIAERLSAYQSVTWITPAPKCHPGSHKLFNVPFFRWRWR
jgi:hypothetical protein